MKRVCKKCGEEKELEEFVLHKLCKFGRGHRCKSCIKIISKTYIRDSEREKERLDLLYL